MKILLVEDREADAVHLTTLLHQLGHTVTVTQNGNDALDYFVREAPDVVITGVFVPGLDGIALTREILRHAAPRWQPVLLVSAECDEELQARAIEAGGDAFFVKPVKHAGLSARLAAIARLLNMQREAGHHLADVRRHLATEDADLQMARHLVEYQMRHDGNHPFDDPAVQQWHHASPCLSGDMLLMGRTPSGSLHLLLADACSNGLSSYVCLQPLIAPFQRMTAKGFPPAAIVRELNNKLRQSLPAGRVVAAQLACVDSRTHVVTLWNGGMPPAFILDGLGRHFKGFELTHAALGALDDEDFDEHTEMHAYAPDEQLVMVSDGLLEAAGPAGERFGEQGLAEVMVGLPRYQRCDEVVAAIEAHLAGEEPAGDISLVLVDCGAVAPLPVLPAVGGTHESSGGNWCLALRLDGAELHHTDVIPLLLGMTGHFQAARHVEGELFVVLSELFNNALDHGLLRLDSRIKQSAEGMETWLLLREERLSGLKDGEIRVWIEQLVENGRSLLRIRCQDSGPGFDVQKVLGESRQRLQGKSVASLPYGRGLALVESISGSIEFGPEGNEVTVLLPLDIKSLEDRA